MGTDPTQETQGRKSVADPTRLPDAGNAPGDTQFVQPADPNGILIPLAFFSVMLVLGIKSSLLLWVVFAALVLLLVTISEHNWWPWIVLLVMVPIVANGILHRRSSAQSAAIATGPTRLVPVPVDKLLLGTGLLVPDLVLELTVTVPAEGEQPQHYVFQNLRVDQLLGANGPVSAFQRSDIKTVVLAVPVDIAPELESVLTLGASTITYSVIPSPVGTVSAETGAQLPAAEEATPSTPATAPDKIYLPLPFDEKTIGTGPLAVGDFVEVTVYEEAEDDEEAPLPLSFSARVAEVVSDAGPVSAANWNAVRQIVLEVSPEQAPKLLEILSSDSRRVVYRKIPALPDSTASIEATALSPTATQLTEVSLPVPLTQNPDPPLAPGDRGRLVIVMQGAPSDAGMPAAPPAAREFCVTVSRQSTETGLLSVQLNIEELARYAEAITAQAAIFLVSDPACSIP